MSGEVIAFPQAPEGVEVRHLRAFVAVAEELNFGRAAARLYLSQPALSRQIRALERLVGCELLRRSTHRVELTVAGSALLDRARRLLADLDEAIATTQSVGGELANRMATMWAPVLEVVAADRDIQEMRTAYETFLAQSPVPDGVEIRPVNAGGVSSLAIGPAGDAETPILYLHGGGYTVGSAYGYRPLVGALVAAAGAGALVPDFRLAPEHPFPAALEDALSAYRWLLDQRGGAGIVLAGDSAGAGLACSLMLTLRAQDLPLPAGAAFLCPGVDPTGDAILSASSGGDPPRSWRTSAGPSRPTSPATPSTTRSSTRSSPTSPACPRCSSRRRPAIWSWPSRGCSPTAPPPTAWTRDSSSTPPTPTSSTSSGRSSRKRQTRSSRRASSSASGWRARPRPPRRRRRLTRTLARHPGGDVLVPERARPTMLARRQHTEYSTRYASVARSPS